MKNRILSISINLTLAAIVLAVGLVGFLGGATAADAFESEILYYGGSENSKGISLTFNVYEGSEIVNQILDILDDYGAKATFFIGGSWADDNIDSVREIYSRGHEIGSHGYFHKDHSKMSKEANIEEIRPSVKLLEMICGHTVTLFAPPSGAFAESTINACAELNLKVIMWSRDTIDWRDKDVATLVDRATKDLKAGEIILMHPKAQTVKALPEILNYIREHGLTAVTVSQNIGE